MISAPADWADHLKAVMQQLLHISRMSIDDFDDFLRQVLELDADTLQVDRVSIWWLGGNDPDKMVCLDCFDRKWKEHSHGLRLLQASYPHYFTALRKKHAIVADDARNDERTAEFYRRLSGSAGYLFNVGCSSPTQR